MGEYYDDDEALDIIGSCSRYKCAYSEENDFYDSDTYYDIYFHAGRTYTSNEIKRWYRKWMNSDDIYPEVLPQDGPHDLTIWVSNEAMGLGGAIVFDED